MLTEIEFTRLDAKRKNGTLTEEERQALAPYKVDNAIIMAAGMGTRFAPLTYEKPKGLLKVKGDILIERQIRQLRAAGITDITLVVGYMKEQFFYLEDKYDVSIVVNPDYYRYNNTSTLMLVLERLKNTYLCSSDNYFAENPFEPYVYDAYYAAVYADGPTSEYCLTTDSRGVITKVTVGGADAWYMLGHAYFSRAFSETWKAILTAEYDNPRVKDELWEDVYARHVRELPMRLRTYPAGAILEFDSLDELRAFDRSYVDNTDSRIIHNICQVLHCHDRDVHDIHVIKQGLTNTSFYFTCLGKKYVYRHPGKGTKAYINRESEAFSVQKAKELHIDDTYIYMDPEEGWKISHYLEGVRNIDYGNKEEVRKSLALVRRLHQARIHSPYDFDIWKKALDYIDKLKQLGTELPADLPAMYAAAEKLHEKLEAEHTEKVLCHNDFYDANLVIDPAGKVTLLDWEYSGNTAPASDIGVFICCSHYTTEEAMDVIREYLQHEPTGAEWFHYLGYLAVCAFHWYLWAVYQENIGKPVGEFLYLYYKYAKRYAVEAEKYSG